MGNDKGLPLGWLEVGFKESCTNISLTGIKVKEKEYKKYGKFPTVDQGKELIGGYFDDENMVIKEEPPYIVFGDHTKVKKFITFKFIPGGDGLKVLKANNIFDPKLLYYFIQAIKLPNKGYARHYQYLEKEIVPLPPINEQYRIVERLEELFSELDAGIKALKTAQEQLKVYRQAVLRDAFEGKLTVEWRNKQDKLQTREALIRQIKNEREALEKEKKIRLKGIDFLTDEEIETLPKIPQEWEWIKLGNITWSVKDGPHYSPQYEQSGIPFISGGNVRPEGVDFKNVKFISLELHKELSKRCLPENGDILYTKGGTTGIARVNTYGSTFSVWVHVAVLKLIQSAKPFYVQHCLNSPHCYRLSQKFTHGVGNQDLGLTRMINITLPICSLQEQQQIVQEIETRLSICDNFQETIVQSLAKAETLRQSILQQAFAGKLVLQDPNDEPACKLLERIRLARENDNSKKTSAKGRTKK